MHTGHGDDNDKVQEAKEVIAQELKRSYYLPQTCIAYSYPSMYVLFAEASWRSLFSVVVVSGIPRIIFVNHTLIPRQTRNRRGN